MVKMMMLTIGKTVSTTTMQSPQAVKVKVKTVKARLQWPQTSI